MSVHIIVRGWMVVGLKGRPLFRPMMAAARGCRRSEGGMAMKNSTNQCARLGASWLSAPLCGATALLMIAGGPLPAVAGGDGKKGQIEVVDPGKTLFRKSYNELTGAWSNWLQKEPPATNPAFDPDGRFCDLNQKGQIWYLAGTFPDEGVADRFCEVPAGKGIFFPILANISFAPEFLEEPPCDKLTEEVDQIRCDVNDDTPIAPFVGLEVTLDGEPVADLFAYRVQSEPGGFTFRLGPLFEVLFDLEPGDRFPAVVDGYWILLKPLPPGLHTVTFSADLGTEVLGANYTLQIVKTPHDEQ
jgi:hypothetical protein